MANGARLRRQTTTVRTGDGHEDRRSSHGRPAGPMPPIRAENESRSRLRVPRGAMRSSVVDSSRLSSILLLLGATTLGCASPRMGEPDASSPVSAEAAEPKPAEVATSLHTDPLDVAPHSDAPDSKASHSHPATSPASPASTTPNARRESPASYSCPMHPEVRSATPGSCPHCGMKLVLEEKRPAPTKEESHDH